MVALVLSILITGLGVFAIKAIGKRRQVGASLTWGEAMVGATGGFALMFWAYGVVPHQWLTYSSNELKWRTDKILVGWKLPFTGKEGFLDYFLPFKMSYETISHIGAVLIYGVMLGLHVYLFTSWKNRGKDKPVEITSGYGRPLVKQA